VFCDIIRFACFFGTLMKQIKQILKQILTDFFPVKKQSQFGTQLHNPFNPCSLFWNTDETDSTDSHRFFFPKKEPVLECDLTIRA
jgi:hypothetical protein